MTVATSVIVILSEYNLVTHFTEDLLIDLGGKRKLRSI